jgi:hypothetical protein
LQNNKPNTMKQKSANPRQLKVQSSLNFLKITMLLIFFNIVIGKFELFSQVESKTIIDDSDHHNYSMVYTSHQDPSKSFFIVAGVRYTQGVPGNKTLNVKRISKDLTSVVWDYDYQSGSTQACYSICEAYVDPSSGLKCYALTGYVDYQGYERAYVLVIDENGNIIDEKVYTDNSELNSYGMYVTFDKSENIFLVSGFVSDSIKRISSNKKSMLLKLDINLNVIWSRFYDTSPYYQLDTCDWDMAEHVLVYYDQNESQNYYFLTGSINIPRPSSQFIETEQGVLALKIDVNGNLIWNRSFSHSEGPVIFEVGVCSTYDPDEDVLHVLYNNSVRHCFGLQEIDNSTGNLQKYQQFIENNPPLGDKYDVNAFDFIISKSNPNHLIITGIYRIRPTTESPPFLISIDITTYNIIRQKYLCINNPGFYNNFNWDFLAFFPTWYHSFIHTPTTLVKIQDNWDLGDYLGVAYRKNIYHTATNNFELELFSFEDDFTIYCDSKNEVIEPLSDFEPIIYTQMNIYDLENAFTISFSKTNIHSYLIHCEDETCN